MKRARSSIIAWILAVALTMALMTLLGRVLAGQDIIAAVLVAHDTSMIPVAVAAMLARLFLFLLAPGWALYIAASLLLQRARARRSTS